MQGLIAHIWIHNGTNQIGSCAALKGLPNIHEITFAPNGIECIHVYIMHQCSASVQLYLSAEHPHNRETGGVEH